jgi:tetratricopeptide (TPR) repeat protein
VRIVPYLLMLLAPLVPLVQGHIDHRLGAFRAQHDVLYLWSGDQIRRLTPGFHNIVADVYWLRTVQYFGGQRVFATDKRFDLLAPLVDITTAIDPRLEIAYEYGATFLAEQWPLGAGNPEAAIALLRRGVGRNPRDWRLRQHLGLFYLFFMNDAARASQVLLEAADVPGAPPYFRTLAAQVLAKGGERRSALTLWQQIYEQSEPGQLKDNALLHLRQLQSFDAADALETAARAFAHRTGRPPATLEELRRSGLVTAPIVDATGVAFEYNPSTGDVSISPQSPIWRRDLAKGP